MGGGAIRGGQGDPFPATRLSPVSTSTPSKGKNIKSAIGEYFETHSELAKEENYEKTETEDGIISSTISVDNNVIKLNR